MTEDSHKRRMEGLFKTWGQRWRKSKKLPTAGGLDMPTAKKTAAQIREQRRKVKLTVAKEARDVQDMARQTAVQALEVIKDVLMNGHRDSDKLSAADIILERAYGKATQPNVNTNVNLNGRKEEVTSAELDKRIETALRGVEELTGRKVKPNKGPERPVNLRKRNSDTGRSTVH
jgi:undecaprenyl pyrophosphate synthase